MSEKRISFLLNIVVREMNSQADGILRNEFGITYSQFVFLMTLSENPDIDVTRLSEALGVTKGAVSKRLSWFVEKGYVRCHHEVGNAKKVLVKLAPDGKKLVERTGAFLEKTFTSTISKSSQNNYQNLVSELEKIHRYLLVRRQKLSSSTQMQ